MKIKLVIELAEGAEGNVNELLRWMKAHGIMSEGEVVRIGPPHGEPVFAWRITGLWRLTGLTGITTDEIRYPCCDHCDHVGLPESPGHEYPCRVAGPCPGKFTAFRRASRARARRTRAGIVE